MKVAITGATGFIGRHLAHALTASGHEVQPIGRHDLQQGSAHLGHRLAVPMQ